MIILQALTDLDLGEYALFRSGVGSSIRKPTSGRKIAYWFPDEKVQADDLVVLYTKKGSRGVKALEGGRTAYFSIGEGMKTLWNDNQFGAALLEVADWQFEVPS